MPIKATNDEQFPPIGVDVIVLAGGLGTRLRSVVSDLPKCMAPVNGRPFIGYVIDHLIAQGGRRFVFSLGYKHEYISNYVEKNYSSIENVFSIEDEPLGTGGAIYESALLAHSRNILVVNGDTLFKANIGRMLAFHRDKESDCTLALKPMQDFDRYGVVELNSDDSIRSFQEKKFYESGLINAGLYAIDRERFLDTELPVKCSFERDYLEKYFDVRRMYGMMQDEYFIDIGVPEDFERAQEELGGIGY